MAITDAETKKHVPSVKRRAVNGPDYTHFSDSQKIEAVTTYLALGNLVTTSAVLKIKECTLRLWKSKDWWKEIEQELRLQDDLILSNRLQRLINKSFDNVADRLEHGDFIYDQKTGQLVRKPVAMKDAHKVGVDLIDKREFLINKLPTSVGAEAIEDKLLKLAEKFAQIASSVKPPVEVTDVIYVDPESPDKDNEQYQEDGHPSIEEPQ